MKIGLVKEVKNHEYRAGMTPKCASAYIAHNHEVFVERDAGIGSGFADEEYSAAGAQLMPDAELVWRTADMIVKVKEPVESEYPLLRENQILYTYLHLAADRPLTDVLMQKKVKAMAYETITNRQGALPCLAPMSEIAGRLSVQEGAKYLERHYGGRGVLLAGVPGVDRGHVAIIGGGTVGTNACKIAVGMGANVTVLDVSAERLSYLDDIFFGRINTLVSTRANIRSAIAEADIVIGAVLIPGRAAPRLVLREDLALMKKGAVVVDVAVDQGGCFETTHATTHQDPIYVVDGIVHYCVANMPGAVARTATIALTNTTLRFGLSIADHGLERASAIDQGLAEGINCYDGKCTYKGVADSLGIAYVPIRELISSFA